MTVFSMRFACAHHKVYVRKSIDRIDIPLSPQSIYPYELWLITHIWLHYFYSALQILMPKAVIESDRSSIEKTEFFICPCLLFNYLNSIVLVTWNILRNFFCCCCCSVITFERWQHYFIEYANVWNTNEWCHLAWAHIFMSTATSFAHAVCGQFI